MSPPRPPDHWIGIDAAAYVFPGDPIDLCDWARMHTFDPARVAAIIESGSRYFHAAPPDSEDDLAARAVARLLDQTDLAAGDVDFLVHVHTMALSPPPLPRSLPLELATRFGMAPAWCASIAQLNCVSVAAVLRVVDALFVTHREAELALVVSVDRLQGEGSRLRHRSGIQSDGAACLLVRRNHPWNRIGRVVISSNGDWFSGAEEAGRVARQMISLEWKYTRDVVNAACADSDLPTHRYDQFLPQNFKRQGWLELCVGLGLPERNFFDRNIGLRGHACCSDLAVNLADAGLATLRAGGSVLTALHSSVGAYAALTLRPVAERQA